MLKTVRQKVFSFVQEYIDLKWFLPDWTFCILLPLMLLHHFLTKTNVKTWECDQFISIAGTWLLDVTGKPWSWTQQRPPLCHLAAFVFCFFQNRIDIESPYYSWAKYTFKSSPVRDTKKYQYLLKTNLNYQNWKFGISWSRNHYFIDDLMNGINVIWNVR